MEIVKIGDSPRERLPESDRPLSGIRVLDLTRVLAGPTAARTLAEHGADVLKITAPHLPNIGYQEYDTGHGKLSAHLDLRYPRDLEILHGLVREADVFSQGYRPGTLGNRGLSPEELLKLRDATGKRRGEIRSVAKAKMRDRKQSRSAAGNASRSGWLGRRMRQAPGGRKLSHPRGIERSG